MQEDIGPIAPKSIRSNFESLVGRKFGIVEVISFAGIEKYKSIWKCRCACGKVILCRGNNLKTGGTKSCGCIRIKSVIRRNTKHGKAKRKSKSAAYISWVGMKTRSTNPNCTGAKNYFLRGIKMDPRWNSFECFYADMGDPPDSGYSLDRIDVNQGYSVNNCRWANRVTQNNNRRDNRRLEYDGRYWTITELANHVGMSRKLLSHRLYLGWDLERATTEPNARTGK